MKVRAQGGSQALYRVEGKGTVHRETTWNTWGPDLDSMELESVSGPPWELLLRQFGNNFVSLDVKVNIGIRKSSSK